MCRDRCRRNRARVGNPLSRSSSEVPPRPGGTNLWQIVTSFTRRVGYQISSSPREIAVRIHALRLFPQRSQPAATTLHGWHGGHWHGHHGWGWVLSPLLRLSLPSLTSWPLATLRPLSAPLVAVEKRGVRSWSRVRTSRRRGWPRLKR